MREARQLLCIVAVVLRFTCRQGRDLPGIGHDDLMPQLFQQTIGPGGMGARLQRDALPHGTLELSLEGFSSGSQAAFFHHFSLSIHHTVVAESVSHIHSHRDLWTFLPLLLLHASATLLHGWSPFAPRVRCGQLILFRETSRLIPSKARFSLLWQFPRLKSGAFTGYTIVRTTLKAGAFSGVHRRWNRCNDL